MGQDNKKGIGHDKAQLEAILMAIGEGLVVIGQDGTVLIVNSTFEKYLQIDKAEMLGKPANEAYEMLDEHLQPIPPALRPYNIALQSGATCTSNKYFFRRKDGSVFPSEVTAAPIEHDGEIIGVVSVCRDITKEKEVDQAKTEFVSLASHQLKTPLTTIKWYTEVLLNDDYGILTNEERQAINEVNNASRRLVSLVNDLLNVSRIDLGTFAINPEQIDLPHLCSSIVKELSILSNSKRVHLIEEYGVIPEFKGDANLLRIIIENLLTNAIKYTPSDGNIYITVKNDETNQKLLLSVRDTGYGIPEHQRSKIFSKLFRAENVMKMNVDGNGLGLYIVKSIVDSAGGSIRFDSELNKGTTFFVEFPITGMAEKKGTKQLNLVHEE